MPKAEIAIGPSHVAHVASFRGATFVSWTPLVSLPALAVAFRARLAPWQFMWMLSIAIFLGCKWETWIRAVSAGVHVSLARNLGYLMLWPGMDARAFLTAEPSIAHVAGRDWIAVSAKTILGASLVLLAARAAAHGHSALVVGWLGMVGLILTLHFGLFHVIALTWRSAGVSAQSIMNAPLRSTSLSDFWGKRWNLGFRQLSHTLVFQPIRKQFGAAAATVAAFLVSGLIHDFVISFPARGGYGLPTAYFLIQGIGVFFERSSLGARIGIGAGFRGWLFTLFCTAGPAFWLFHPIFVRTVMLPFFVWIGRL